MSDVPATSAKGTGLPDFAYRAIQLALALGAVAVVVYCYKTGSTLTYMDERQYLEIAEGVARGDGYKLAGLSTAYRPPTWPFLLAAAAALGLPLAVISLIPAALLIAAAWVAGKIGVRLSGSRFGIVAALAVLAYPLNIYAAGTLYPQALATALLLGIWYVTSRAEDDVRRSVSVREALSLGLLSAAVSLAVPTMTLTSVVVLGWLLIRQAGNRVRFAAAAGFGALAPLAAWTIRNLITMHSATVLSTSTGVNLLLGNSENTTPTNGLAADIAHYRAAADQMGLDEVQRNSYFTHQAVDWIREHPGDAVTLYLGKLLNYFSPYNAPATEGQGSSTQLLIAWLAALAVVLVFIVRLYLSRTGALRLQPSEKLFIAIFFANAPIMAVFFTRVRFRQPLDAILLVEAGIAIAVALMQLRQRERSSNVD